MWQRRNSMTTLYFNAFFLFSLYRGVHLWQPPGNRAVFGGQIVGQALVAAGKTVEPDLHVHSLHCYFIRPGQILVNSQKFRAS